MLTECQSISVQPSSESSRAKTSENSEMRFFSYITSAEERESGGSLSSLYNSSRAKTSENSDMRFFSYITSAEERESGGSSSSLYNSSRCSGELSTTLTVALQLTSKSPTVETSTG